MDLLHTTCDAVDTQLLCLSLSSSWEISTRTIWCKHLLKNASRITIFRVSIVAWPLSHYFRGVSEVGFFPKRFEVMKYFVLIYARITHKILSPQKDCSKTQFSIFLAGQLFLDTFGIRLSIDFGCTTLRYYNRLHFEWQIGLRFYILFSRNRIGHSIFKFMVCDYRL